MPKLKKAKINKIKGFLKKLPRVIGEHAFLTSITLILLALTLGAEVFYKYSISVSQKKMEISEKPLYFDEKSFQEVLKIWEERQKKFEEAELREYPNLFRAALSSEELTE